MALNPLVSLIGRLVARSGRKCNRQTDRQNDKTTTVTLAAHAHRGLMRDEKEERSKQGQTNNKAKQHSTPKVDVHKLIIRSLLYQHFSVLNI